MSNNLITEVDILDEAKENFLTYAEEVLTDRAIPSAEDGLLSAQRKILWTMEDYLKMDSKSKTKKCNAVVGSTLATSYFHGDAACYGVLCKMSQDFLMRYPLVQGQGSLGTQENNDMVASSRYTEAKPSIYADLMMNDFKKNVVPFKETYNGEFMEPVVLPSLFPNAICNGRQAIGISMAHNTAPHNLTEVCNTAIAYIEGKINNVDDLLQYMPGPDFPLGGTVLNIKDVRKAFETGKSTVSLKIQGDYEIDGQTITFTTIPYRTYRNKIKEQIEKNIDTFDELLSDFDDESSIGSNKLVFHVKNGISPTKVLNKLFLLTDLQTTLSYNMNFIVNGTPKLCSMIELINCYVKHQENILIKATEYDKDKAEARAHILEGLIAAVDKIDEVIELIKKSANRQEAKNKLISFLSIDETQAVAILDMKIGRLTRIDKEELISELKEKQEIIARCIDILTHQERRNICLIKEIAELRDKYGDVRRTKLVNVEIPKNEKEPVPVEIKDCMVIVTNQNKVKRVDIKNFKPQRRNSVGIKTNGDITIFSQKTNTQDYLLVFTTKGKMYRILVDNIPEGTNTTSGTLLATLIEMEKDEVPVAYTTLTRDTDKKFILFATKNGTIKKVSIEEYDKMKRTGVLAISLKEDDEVRSAIFINQEEVIIATKNGHLIRFETAEMPISSRTAQGVKGIKLNDGDEVLSISAINNELFCVIVCRNTFGKKIPINEITLQKRGGKGMNYSKEPVAGIVLANSEDNILISGNISSVVIPANDITTSGRTAQGSITLKGNSEVVSVAKT